MTQVEAACFPDLVPSLSSQKYYLAVRNRILRMWLENPKQQLTAEDALKRFVARKLFKEHCWFVICGKIFLYH